MSAHLSPPSAEDRQTRTSPAVAPRYEPPQAEERDAVEDLFDAIGDVISTHAWRLEMWDGRAVGPWPATIPPRFTLRIHSRSALDRFLGAHPELAFGRAYVAGELDVAPLNGFYDAIQGTLASTGFGLNRGSARRLAHLARMLWQVGARPEWRPLAGIEARLRGSRQSRRRAAAAISHHYDVPTAFYDLFLDPSLSYSSAYFADPGMDLAQAQRAKVDLACCKLRLQPGERLLDIGCGWGGLVIQAAENWGVHATGVTISHIQAEEARRRIRERGLQDRVEIRLVDYRDRVDDRPFDAITSMEMIEHVGRDNLVTYGEAMRRNLRPGGRALMQVMTVRPGDDGFSRFLSAFIFPDGQFPELGGLLTAMQAAGLDVRDVESLRDHYPRTLASWVDRLQQNDEKACRLVGREKVRAWTLYMASGITGFATGGITVSQILMSRLDERGSAQMPATRVDWYRDPSAAALR